MKKKILKIKCLDNGSWQKPDVFPFLNYTSSEYDIIHCDDPDFVFYSCFGSEFMKYDDCIRIFYTGENIRPDFNECDYAIGFDRLTFGDRYIRRSVYTSKPILDLKNNYENRKFCNFIYSNGSLGKGAHIRKEFFDALSKYKHIDAPGKIKNNMSDAITSRTGSDWINSKLNFIKNYKFTIAFENDFYPGYVTEKLIHPFLANSIPIYMGDPDIAQDFNTSSFINCVDFKNWSELIEYIEYLDNNDNAYMDMLKQPAMSKDYQRPQLEEWLCNIFEHGKNFRKMSRNDWNYPAKHYRRFIDYVWDNLDFDNLSSSSDTTNTLDNLLYLNSQKCKANYTKILDPLILKIKSSSSAQPIYIDYINTYSRFSNLQYHIESMLNSVCGRHSSANSSNRDIKWINDCTLEQKYRHLFRLLWPNDVKNKSKIRVGGSGDGGHVQIEQHPVGVALSLGVSFYSPWDLEMAQKGWNILQFDGTIENPPQCHSNMRFFKKNLVSNEDHGDNEITLAEILEMLPGESDMVLQMDIEGAEWALLESITKEQLCCFKQIIAEFHGMTDIVAIDKRINLLEKICRTHVPVHFHYNNNGKVLGFSNFLVSSLFEISFFRRDNEIFTPSLELYPTNLDSPNVSKFPDIYIGNFDAITSDQVPPR